MKVISFVIDGVTARAHVLAKELFMAQLRDQGIITDQLVIDVDWNNNGKFVKAFTQKMHLVCPGCGQANSLSHDDLGFEEFECPSCENTYTVPATPEEISVVNLENLKAATSGPPPSHYRVMFQGEDGELSCLKNGVPREWSELVLAGFQSHYTEGQKCWLEPEETMADLRRMCDDHSDRYEY
jgi:hypothetical protein